jgi:hypothetical protein
MKRSPLAFAGCIAAFGATHGFANELAMPAFNFPQNTEKTAAVSTDAEPVVVEADNAPQIVRQEQPGSVSIKGFVEASAGYGQSSNGGADVDSASWSLRGSVNSPVQRKLNIQFDAAYYGASSDVEDSYALSGTVHAYMRVPGLFAAGGFVSVARIGSDTLTALSASGLDDFATDFVAGGEAALYTDQATLYAVAGFGRFDYSGTMGDHLVAGAGVRVYANDNLRFDVEGSYNEISSASADISAFALSATGSYRMGARPFTVFGGYRYDQIATDSATTSVTDTDTHTVFGGIRYHFGSGSLKEEERSGPAWSAVPVKL